MLFCAEEKEFSGIQGLFLTDNGVFSQLFDDLCRCTWVIGPITLFNVWPARTSWPLSRNIQQIISLIKLIIIILFSKQNYCSLLVWSQPPQYLRRCLCNNDKWVQFPAVRQQPRKFSKGWGLIVKYSHGKWIFLLSLSPVGTSKTTERTITLLFCQFNKLLQFPVTNIATKS